MKKLSKLKTLISVSLMFLMLLPNASAYYSSFTLRLNLGMSNFISYPMYKGTNVKLTRKQKTLYDHSYTLFLFENPLKHGLEHTAGKYLSVSKPQEWYEQEIRHVGACSYSTALLLGCQISGAKEFSEGMVRICNSLIGYPRNFNKNLHVYVANYIYGILGFLYKEGTVDDVRSNSLYRFSSLAHLYSSHFCSIERVPYMSHISEEMFKLQTEGQ